MRIILTTSFLLLTFLASAQRMTREQYLAKYKDEAIKSMKEYKIPASIKLAQAVLESSNGNSELSKKSNNHFGIKCHSSWKGKKTYHDDDKKQECFRVYKSVYESYSDHSKFLMKPRYAKCFELKITDYKGWAKELKRAGYATNPKYPALLIKIIEDNKLYEYDQIALGKGKPSKGGNGNKSTKPKGKKNTTRPKGGGNDEFSEVDLYDMPVVKLSDNKIKFVVAKKGDTPESLARKLNLGPWQLRLYNDVKKGHSFKEGDVVYIQPKKNKARIKFHIAKKGETIESISQKYGVKVKSIYRKNRMKPGDKIKPGQKVALRKKIAE